MNMPKYSQIEYERRWLVKQAPAGLTSQPHRLIEDKYLSCGRLRLRKITHSDSDKTEFKLCKKYGAVSSSAEPITNIYLSEQEYAALINLDGHTLSKKRHRVVIGSNTFSLDVFSDSNALSICEIEAESAEALERIPAPPYAEKEITGLKEWTGASLAKSFSART
ncbi:hypothetical protein BH10BDE1_BH10BDE1_28720 [soil metagenome]